MCILLYIHIQALQRPSFKEWGRFDSLLFSWQLNKIKGKGKSSNFWRAKNVFLKMSTEVMRFSDGMQREVTPERGPMQAPRRGQVTHTGTSAQTLLVGAGPWGACGTCTMQWAGSMFHCAWVVEGEEGFSRNKVSNLTSQEVRGFLENDSRFAQSSKGNFGFQFLFFGTTRGFLVQP